MPRKKCGVTIVGGSHERARFNWPCFHCGRSIVLCAPAAHAYFKATGDPLPLKTNEKCCRKCRGRGSH